MVGETVGIFENAAANHETVNIGVVLMKSESGRFGLNIAVNDEFGLRAKLVAEGQNLWNEFVVSGDFGHFFSGAEMDGEGGGVLIEEGWEPGLIFCRIRPAEASFD